MLVSGEGAPFSAPRHTLETAAIVVPTLGVALLFPSSAEKIFAITGAALFFSIYHTCLCCVSL